jgi:hypothetical protein
MKNHFKAKTISKNYFKTPIQVYLVLLVVFFAGNVNAQTAYKADGDSEVKVSIGSIPVLSNLETSALNAEGDFIFQNGKLENIKSLKLNVPIDYASDSEVSNPNSIKFQLTHVMVLPVLKKVFVVGFLNVHEISHRIDMEFDLTYNEGESITLSGIKKLKWSDYQKNSDKPSIYLASYINTDEVTLDMKFVFTKIIHNTEEVNQSAPVIASTQLKTDFRFEQAATR